jgi:hypothetical protein
LSGGVFHSAPSDDAWVVGARLSHSIADWNFGLEGLHSQWQEPAQTTQEAIWGISLNGTDPLSDSIDPEGRVAYSYADCGNVGAFGSPIPSVHGIEIDFGTNISC